MNEEFLKYIWKYKRFQTELKDSNNETVSIQYSGQENTDGGPDFTSARIKIGDTEWAGNIEIHVNTSDWFKHGHHYNESYDSVILHVVYQNDIPVLRKNKLEIPVLELRGKINESLFYKYQAFMNTKRWTPCYSQIIEVEPFILHRWKERLIVERLEQKSLEILNLLKNMNNDWEQTFYILLAKAYGFKINTIPFEMLAKSIPLISIKKHRDNLFQLEAMFYGQSGLLDKNFNDQYPKDLKKEYYYLKNKFLLEPITAHLWQFFRLRPMSFPTIRISQFAAILNHHEHLTSAFLSSKNIESIIKIFDIPANSYWNNHYDFDKISQRNIPKILGEDSIKSILINLLVPFLFVNAKQNGNFTKAEQAMDLLRNIKPEKNSIIKKWQQIGVSCNSAFDTQALLQLRNQYCSQKKCLDCEIGNYLLR